MTGLTKRSLLGPVALAAVLVAACGGGEETTPRPAAPTPRPQPTATSVPAATPTSPASVAATPTAPTPAPTATLRAAPTPTPPAAPTPTPPPASLGKKLTVVVSSFSNEAVRPSLGGAYALPVYAGGMYDWMTWANRDGTLAPGILKSWDMARDGTSWTLTVRDDMRLHNGDKVTAEDVKFSIEQVVAAVNQPQRSTNTGAWAQFVASVDVVSPTVARVNVKRPWPLMPYDMSPRVGTEGAVVPQAYTQRVGISGFDRQPIGTGPWKMTRHDMGVRFVFESAEAPHPYRESPKYKELEILAVPEDSTRVAMLKTGAANIIEIGSFDTAREFQRSGTQQVLSIANYNSSSVVFFGVDDPRIRDLPAGKREVREALTLAVNAKEITETIFGGLAEVATRILVSPGTLGYRDSWKPKEYNPVRARDLLAQAGYSRGFSIRVISSTYPGSAWMPRVAEAVAGYWSGVGVQPQIIPLDWAAFTALYRARPQAADLIGQAAAFRAGFTPTNISLLPVVYHSKGITLFMARPQMDALIDEAASSLDSRRREQLIGDIEDLADSEHVTIPIAAVPALFGADRSVGAWKPVAGGNIGIVLETVTPKR